MIKKSFPMQLDPNAFGQQTCAKCGKMDTGSSDEIAAYGGICKSCYDKLPLEEKEAYKNKTLTAKYRSMIIKIANSIEPKVGEIVYVWDEDNHKYIPGDETERIAEVDRELSDGSWIVILSELPDQEINVKKIAEGWGIDNGQDQEPEEIDEPDEEDVFVGEDGHSAYYLNKPIVTLGPVRISEIEAEGGSVSDELYREIKSWMDSKKYWPNVWTVSDHGNFVNVSQEVSNA